MPCFCFKIFVILLSKPNKVFHQPTYLTSVLPFLHQILFVDSMLFTGRRSYWLQIFPYPDRSSVTHTGRWMIGRWVRVVVMWSIQCRSDISIHLMVSDTSYWGRGYCHMTAVSSPLLITLLIDVSSSFTKRLAKSPQQLITKQSLHRKTCVCIDKYFYSIETLSRFQLRTLVQSFPNQWLNCIQLHTAVALLTDAHVIRGLS